MPPPHPGTPPQGPVAPGLQSIGDEDRRFLELPRLHFAPAHLITGRRGTQDAGQRGRGPTTRVNDFVDGGQEVVGARVGCWAEGVTVAGIPWPHGPKCPSRPCSLDSPKPLLHGSLSNDSPRAPPAAALSTSHTPGASAPLFPGLWAGLRSYLGPPGLCARW